ncbi:DUF2807 domain-containing protein [Altererythrobacter sp. HHU K3-1]|uniref:DUF2807 domain-containing protein n=2 Tax=Qipengyuania atrilutea TaxID=2744473 RepID=A0A850H3H2_9SPHN|nr:DUF2807 domain-containing protein [Actirhodobacter atriluteus]
MAGCSDMTFESGSNGVPLAEFDTSGEAPTRFTLSGPDRVILTRGDTLDIDVSGDSRAVDLLRFERDGDNLTVARAKSSGDNGTAIVRLTMPAPRNITLAGSGEIEASDLAAETELSIAGSGTIRAPRVAAQLLDVNIAGSGTLEAAGRADRLDLNIAGSGDANMSSLKVEAAEINIMGSGDARFASDGQVDANIMGSGDVTVIGRARCKVSAMGSGTVTCEAGTETRAER